LGEVRRFRQVGGHVVIDFVNTLGGQPDDPDDEYLHSYGDLIDWTERVDLLCPTSAARLKALADQQPAAALLALDRNRELRESLDRILRDRIEPRQEAQRQEDEARIHAHYLAAITAASLQLSAGGLRWTWSNNAEDLQQPTWHIAVAAVDALQMAPLHLLSRCQHCRWLFLDTSRQHNRRWCSMDGCGAIVKMRRYRAKGRPQHGT
jgi:predicted RNA-binding Zn ribbon-like protein